MINVIGVSDNQRVLIVLDSIVDEFGGGKELSAELL